MSPADAGGAGHRLGRYHLGDRLGGGPSGQVYRATAGGGRTFAVKRFDAAFVRDAGARARLAAAARAYGSLENPRIARLHEFGVADGETFSATELVPGIDLERLLATARRPVLPARAAVALLSRAARAVGYAHGRGIPHLGICPTNLIATADGDIRVTDFGFLPPRLGGRPAEDESLAARVPYLAPEQLSGGKSSPATDVFQLGVLAWELLTGERPFSGATPQQVAAAINAARPAPPALPTPLARVLVRCLARSPFGRFPDASALADALDAAARTGPLPGRPEDAARIVGAAIKELGASARPPETAESMPAPAPARAPASRAETFGETDTSVATLVRTDVADVRDSATTLIRPAASRDEPADAGEAAPSVRWAPLGFDEEPTGEATEVAEPIFQPAAIAPADAAGGKVAAAALPLSALAATGAATASGAPPTDLDEAAAGPAAAGAGPRPAAAPAEPISRRVEPAAADPAPPAREPSNAPLAGGTAVPQRRGGRRLALALLICAGMGAGAGVGYWAYLHFGGGNTALASPPARAVVAAPPDAGVPDAAPADAPPAKLRVNTAPKGAKIYVDGTMVGESPVALAGNSDEHKLAVILPGYKLYTAEIKGRGKVHVDLQEVTPPGGPAGIKVRCHHKNRYYVIVDGYDIGQLCPTERIGVEMGRHVVEIYDPVTDSRRVYHVHVKQTRLSLRVHVD